jgi:hypothetical protein
MPSPNDQAGKLRALKEFRFGPDSAMGREGTRLVIEDEDNTPS